MVSFVRGFEMVAVRTVLHVACDVHRPTGTCVPSCCPTTICRPERFCMLTLVTALELLRSMIDHKKVLILALNGPAVGGGAAWFPGIADIVLASSTAWLQCPFSALGLVPENGSALSFAQHMGIHRANDFLMFGRKLSPQELLDAGMYNYVWDVTGDAFQSKVVEFLEEQLAVNDGKSMIEMKRLQNAPIRDARLIAVVNAIDALAERFVEDAPTQRFEEKRKLLEEKRKAKAKL